MVSVSVIIHELIKKVHLTAQMVVAAAAAVAAEQLAAAATSAAVVAAGVGAGRPAPL